MPCGYECGATYRGALHKSVTYRISEWKGTYWVHRIASTPPTNEAAPELLPLQVSHLRDPLGDGTLPRSRTIIVLANHLKMAGNLSPSGAGGFLLPTLPSPSPSAASTRSISGLPHPRNHPLRPGSAKEDMVRNYVEERILHISRRYVKKFGIPEAGDEVVGYKSMAELCKDLEALINIIWISGTRE